MMGMTQNAAVGRLVSPLGMHAEGWCESMSLHALARKLSVTCHVKPRWLLVVLCAQVFLLLCSQAQA